MNVDLSPDILSIFQGITCIAYWLVRSKQQDPQFEFGYINIHVSQQARTNTETIDCDLEWFAAFTRRKFGNKIDKCCQKKTQVHRSIFP